MSVVIEILVVAVMLVINGFFVAYEMALASVSRARLSVLVAKKLKGATEAVFMKDNIEASFAVVQLGITFSTSIAAATGGLSASSALSPWLARTIHVGPVWADILAIVFWVIPLSCVTIVLSELLPKLLALHYRERVCLWLSPVMERLYHALSPLVRVFELAVKGLIKRFLKGSSLAEGDGQGLHELQAAAALARTSRLIGAHQERIVVSAAQLSTRSIKTITIPLAEVSRIPMTATLSQALIRAHMDMHTRFPVCQQEDDPQSIEGYVNFKDIMAALKLNPADPSIKGIVRPLKVIDGEKAISEALEVMIQEKLHIIMVAGKKGDLIGMVTLEDIMEELVGEIEDEFDRLPGHAHPFPGGWIMGGAMAMTAVAEITGASLSLTVPNERLAEWCVRQGSEKLAGSQEIIADGLRVTIRKFRRRKVSEAAVSLERI
jgi:putative hemolysin